MERFRGKLKMNAGPCFLSDVPSDARKVSFAPSFVWMVAHESVFDSEHGLEVEKPCWQDALSARVLLCLKRLVVACWLLAWKLPDFG